jgi:hypothetical protein
MYVGENSQISLYVVLVLAIAGTTIASTCMILATIALRSILQEIEAGNKLLNGIEARLSDIARAIDQPKPTEDSKTRSKKGDY